MSLPAVQLPLPTSCLHCGLQLPSMAMEAERATWFCCAGCQVVHDLIDQQGLGDFYRLRPEKIQPLLNYFQTSYDTSWLAREAGFLRGDLTLRMQGVQCTACVWLIQQVSRRFDGVHVDVNVTLGQVRVRFAPPGETFLLWVKQLAEFGYRVAPLKGSKDYSENRGLLIRLGICAALAMNAMLLAVAIYTGLDAKEPQLFSLFRHLNMVFGMLALAVGGSYFIRRAYLGVRRGVLHFDLPVSVGIIGATLGSLVLYLRGGEGYFDSLSIFITLMLAGRYVQNRLVEKHRQQMATSTDLLELRVRRLGTSVEEIPLASVKAGDRLLIPSGGIIPVEARLIKPATVDVALDWMTGEAAPQLFKAAESIPSGARLLSQTAAEVVAAGDFSWSQLAALSSSVRLLEEESSFWQRFSKVYVGLVLLATAGGFLFWIGRDLQTALRVAIAVAVVTCPCSLGLAVPLARMLANRRLVGRGVFVRQPQLYEALVRADKIFFDKTGTLTLSQLEFKDPEKLQRLSAREQTILFNAVAASRHPASQAIYKTLGRTLAPYQLPSLAMTVTEVAGEGLRFEFEGERYRLGREVGKGAEDDAVGSYQVVWQRDDEAAGSGETVVFTLEEVFLAGAEEVIGSLRRQGKQLFLISGDRSVRVRKVAARLGFAPENVYGDCRPADKEAIVRRFARHEVLYIGDGLNDAAALGAAAIAGTPLGEQGALVNSSDFVFLATDLHWLPAMFQVARRLRVAVRFNLAFALLYNLCAVSAAWAGLIGPLTAALLMPLSAILVLTVTGWSLMKPDMDHVLK